MRSDFKKNTDEKSHARLDKKNIYIIAVLVITATINVIYSIP